MKSWKTVILMALAAIAASAAIAFFGGVIWCLVPREGEKVLDATACEIPENDTAYARAVLQSDSLIRAQFLTAQSLQGPAVRGEAENLPDVAYETRRAIESQQDRARRVLEKRYHLDAHFRAKKEGA